MEPSSAAPSEADPPPGLLTLFWNVAEDDDLRDATRLADGFGDFVLEPTCWPDGAQEPQYVLNVPNPVSPVFDVPTYGIAAELPGHPVRLLVIGRRGTSPHRAGRNGWFAAPGLEAANGLARDDGIVAHACLEQEGHLVHVTMCPSVDDAIAVARSLRVVRPARR